MRVFLPFSNSNYRNNWGQNFRMRKGDFRAVLAIEEKSHWNDKNKPSTYYTIIQRDPNHWYANIVYSEILFTKMEI